MPKTETFLKQYGYVRHPEDRDNLCFWCGQMSDGWDYTPPRKEVARFDEVAQAWKNANPGQQFYAVSCCEKCKNTMYPKRMTLLTIHHKRFFWAGRKKTVENINGAVDIVRLNSMYPWQVRLGDGSIADKPDEMCNAAELQAKRVFYGMPAPDLPPAHMYPEDTQFLIDGKDESKTRGTPPNIVFDFGDDT